MIDSIPKTSIPYSCEQQRVVYVRVVEVILAIITTHRKNSYEAHFVFLYIDNDLKQEVTLLIDQTTTLFPTQNRNILKYKRSDADMVNIYNVIFLALIYKSPHTPLYYHTTYIYYFYYFLLIYIVGLVYRYTII